MNEIDKRLTVPGILAAGLLILVLLNGCQPQSEAKLHVISGPTMGTSYSVKIVKDNRPESDYDSLEVEINRLLVEVNRQMSTYLKNSELSQFNASQDTGWFAISSDFAKVLQASLDICRESGGALDITVGPLVNLWGFGPENRPVTVPTAAELAERQKWVGYQKISVRQNPPAVKKRLPQMYCDLSATAKGFGVDKIWGYLDSLKFQNYLVEIGGEARGTGTNASGVAWRMGVSTPDQQQGIQKVVSLNNLAIATSGDYYNYYEVDGVRYSHTIDPQTGRPITHNLASVTIIDSTCLGADGLATALDVMGPEKGFQFALERNLPVFMIVREASGFVEKMTPEFEKILQIKQAQ